MLSTLFQFCSRLTEIDERWAAVELSCLIEYNGDNKIVTEWEKDLAKLWKTCDTG